MTDIKIFESEEFGKVRTTTIDGEPWFAGRDIALALGYKDTPRAVKDHVDEEDKRVGVLPTPRGGQEAVIINESGLYSLILSSKLPKAKAFKRWVTSEVLPAIRKTGHYGTAQKPTPTTDPAKLAELVDTVAGLARAQRKNPREVAYCAAVVMHQYGVDLPSEFLTSQIHGEHILAQELEAEWNRVRNYKPILPWNE